jgi:uncharacterized protein YjdB
MATLRDQLLPLVDTLRGLPVTFGIRRYAVTIRRRVWSGAQQGEGTATDYNIPLIPAPKVRDITSRDMSISDAEIRSIGQVVGNLYRIEKITPRYTTAAGATGGYLAEQIRLWPSKDTGAAENLVSLVGDDGLLRECQQLTFEQDRAFGYSMVAKEIDRPRTSLQSMALTPATVTLKAGATQQLAAVGTFSGGATSSVTTLSAWSSSNPAVATVDIYGNVTAVGTGSATITALCLQVTAAASVTVS